MKNINIGIIGLGTVGSGVVQTLKDFPQIQIKKIAVKNINKPRNIDALDTNLLTDNPFEIVNDENIDIVVEVIGGCNPAFELITTAIKNGKHIVTANKELLAKRGEEIFKLANEYGRVVLYEAAIGGGIPLIMPIKTILSGNKINKVAAILNGTTNYILTKMDEENADYNEVLEEAQKLGYAETDPTGDVEGFDTAYKIATLSTLAFNKRVNINKIYREGITHISAKDIKAAKELGYKIKLIALAQMDENNKADVRVHPMFVASSHPLASVNGVTNAVTLSGFPVGDIMLTGPGAGEFPTASSVLGDILCLAVGMEASDNPLPQMKCKHEINAEQINIILL